MWRMRLGLPARILLSPILITKFEPLDPSLLWHGNMSLFERRWTGNMSTTSMALSLPNHIIIKLTHQLRPHLQNAPPYSQLGHTRYQHNYIRYISASFPDCRDPALRFHFIFIADMIQACKQLNIAKMSRLNPYDGIPSQEFPIKVHVEDFSTQGDVETKCCFCMGNAKHKTAMLRLKNCYRNICFGYLQKRWLSEKKSRGYCPHSGCQTWNLPWLNAEELKPTNLRHGLDGSLI